MYMATPQQQQHLLLLHLLFGPVCCLTDVSLVWHVVYSFRDGGGGGLSWLSPLKDVVGLSETEWFHSATPWDLISNLSLCLIC